MIPRLIETPSILTEDLWVRVNQARAPEHTSPVEHQREREEQSEQRRDAFERQFPGGRQPDEVAAETVTPPPERPTVISLPAWLGGPTRFIGIQLSLPGMGTAYTPPPPVPPDSESGSALDLEA